jgi:hypothetical protein
MSGLGDRETLAIILTMQPQKRVFVGLLFSIVILSLTACRSEPDRSIPPAWTPFAEFIPSPTGSGQEGGSRSSAALLCVNDARFIEDLTLPDGTVVKPGAVLDKRWSVQNSGDCNWGPGYHLVRIGEDSLEGANEIALYPARAGSSAIWQVILSAPDESGDYLSRWQARNPDGRLFGDEVFLLVSVVEPTPTPTPEPSPTP